MVIDNLVVRDAVIRQAAFDQIRDLQSRDLILSHETIQEGFVFDGQRWPLWNPQRGIFKPRGLPSLLSIRTVFPRKGARIWYDDQRRVHEQIFAGDEELDYAFMGTAPGRWTVHGLEHALIPKPHKPATTVEQGARSCPVPCAKSSPSVANRRLRSCCRPSGIALIGRSSSTAAAMANDRPLGIG